MYYFYYIIHPRNPAKLITGRCFAPSSFPTLRVLLLDNEKMWHSICSPRIKLDFRFEPKHFRSLTGLCYLLTPWCRVLLEKLTGLQLVKKFPVFYGNRRFITALTSIRQLSLSWASPIKSTYPHPTSWRSILILFNRLGLGLPSGLYSFGFPTKTLYTPSPHPYAPHAQPISFFSILTPAQYWVRSTDQLMLYSETIAACLQNHTELMHTPCGQNTEVLVSNLAVCRVTTTIQKVILHVSYRRLDIK